MWKLDPKRSAITFRVKNMWGLLRVKGRFIEFTGGGQPTGKGAAFGRLDVRPVGTGTRVWPTSSASNAFQTSASHRHGGEPTKGITARLSLPVTITELDGGSVQISGEADIDRSRFGLG